MKLSLRTGWPQAIAVWRETGRTDLIERLIMTGRYVPVDCRKTLADIIAGRESRRRGNPHLGIGNTLRDARIWLDYQDTRDSYESDAAAYRALAEKYRRAESTIRGIVDKYRAV